MCDFNQRIATFRNWPYHVDYQPADFADAGFFYLGVGDRVKCFYCNGGLQYWNNDQEPWSEHAKWFPKYVAYEPGLCDVMNVGVINDDISGRYNDAKPMGVVPRVCI